MEQLFFHYWTRVSHEFFLRYVKVSVNFCIYRRNRAWDYNPEVGLVIAGSANPKTDTVEISDNGGLAFRELPGIKYSNKVYGACTVIVDRERIFVAGGLKSMKLIYFTH